MREASVSPIPGKVISCFFEALLMSIGLVGGICFLAAGADADAIGAVGGEAEASPARRSHAIAAAVRFN